MIDIAAAPITCLNCGKAIAQKTGRGHRLRHYCNPACKQAHYRKQHGGNLASLEEAEARITELESQIEQFQRRLNLEERMRQDHQVYHFQRWLKTHPQAQDSDVFKRLLADSRLPLSASRAMYEARLRQYGYSAEDILLFEDAWKSMLFFNRNQS